jgi:hypothetical protein
MKTPQYDRLYPTGTLDLSGHTPQPARHGRTNPVFRQHPDAFRWVFALALALILIPSVSFGTGTPPTCTPDTSTAPPDPNATITLIGVSGLTNYYCLGDTIGASVSYTNTAGEITTTITHDDCSVDVSSSSCGIQLILTNCTWSASVGGWSTNGTGITTPPLKPTDCGAGSVSFQVAWTNLCDGSSGGGVVSSNFNVVAMTSLCEATLPTNRNRLSVGVGELVDLTLVGGPSSTTWSLSGGGTLSATNGTTITFTAPDRATNCTITANCIGTSGCNTKTFIVYEPSSVNLSTNFLPLRHASGRPDIGFQAVIGLMPDTVNFANVECQEEAANFTASGVFSFMNGNLHQSNGPTVVYFSPRVYSGFGTAAWIPDIVYSGDSTSNLPPFTNGTESVIIPWDFRVGSGAWKTNFTTLTHYCSLGSGGNLSASKDGAHWSCLVSNSTCP